MQKFLVNTSGFDQATASQIMTVALLILLRPSRWPADCPISGAAAPDDDLL